MRTPRRGGRRIVAALAVVLALGVAAGLSLQRTGRVRSDASGVPQAAPSVSHLPMPASRHGLGAAEIPSAAPQPGIVKITTAPPGADVELDGAPVGLSVLTLNGVKPGRHMVKVSRAGYRSVSREFEVTAGETLTLEIVLSTAQRAPASRRTAPAAPPLPPPPPP